MRVNHCGMLIGFGVLAGLGSLPGVAQAQVRSSSGLSTYTTLTSGQQRGQVYINGRPVVYTHVPAMGINLDVRRSESSYVLPRSVRSDGLPAWFYGYPPYYGPRLLNPVSSFARYGIPPFDFSARPWYWPRTYATPPLFEIARRVDPALLDLPAVRRPVDVPPASPAAPVVPRDEAADALVRGAYELAVDLYLSRLGRARAGSGEAEVPVELDAHLLRLMGLALAGARHFDEAAEVFAHAYEIEPGLFDEPVDGRGAIGSSMEMRRIVLGAVKYAHEVNTALAWKMVGYLMQAEGRKDQARNMFERAAELAPVPGKGKKPTIPGGVLPEKGEKSTPM